ncbi:hypothetical protein Ade02nite_92620 [Paractinoplanes deccanensis]|uniref:Uncharacterized protein n=1 Tax=Paractinoplanes deccanensis TaxID=113561 RepID=A0ABQ3YKV3_9ACTN|nr:hypothetical protein Ade02nite_92620 [Actinoplanes deccanensis]
MIGPITIRRDAVYLRFVTVRFAPDPSRGADSGDPRKSDLRLSVGGITRESPTMPASSEVSPGKRFARSLKDCLTGSRAQITVRSDEAAGSLLNVGQLLKP